MTHRTSFALDKATVGRLKHLSGVWHVSQAEVVRRAIALADEQAKAETDPAAALKRLHATDQGLVREEAEAYLADVDANRRTWRGDG